VLEAIRDGRIDAVASWELAGEVVEVLRRPAIRRYGVTEGDIEAVLAILGPLLPDVDVAVELRDPDDAPVIAAALAGRASVIVTGDRDLLDDADLAAWLAVRGIVVMTPAEALATVDR
jgi:putative PIN family toxin of toxin-antitoxin system